MQRGRVPPTRAVHYSARYLSVDRMLSRTLVWIYRGAENAAFHFSHFHSGQHSLCLYGAKSS